MCLFCLTFECENSQGTCWARGHYLRTWLILHLEPSLPFWNLQLHASMTMRYRNLIPSGLNKSLSNIATIYFLKFYFYASRIIVNSLDWPTAWYWYICFYKRLFNYFNKTLLNISRPSSHCKSSQHKSEASTVMLMEAGFQTQICWATSLLPFDFVVVGTLCLPRCGR